MMKMEENKLLDKKDVCNMLKISVGSLDGLMRRNEISYVKFDRSVRFKIEEVNKLIRSKSYE